MINGLINSRIFETHPPPFAGNSGLHKSFLCVSISQTDRAAVLIGGFRSSRSDVEAEAACIHPHVKQVIPKYNTPAPPACLPPHLQEISL